MRTRSVLKFAPCALALMTDCRTGATRSGVAAYLEQPALAPARRQGRWFPEEGVELSVRVRCDGEGADRACRLEIAMLREGTDGGDGGETLLASEPCGAAIPYPGVDTDRTVLVLVGEDARGGWRQAARWIPERRAIQWTRRRYDDGM